MKTALRWLVVVLVVCLAAPALAQVRADRDFNLQTFHLAPGRGSFLSIEGARVDDHLGWSIGGFALYQYRPLDFVTPEGTTKLVGHYGAFDFQGSFSIYKLVEFGFALPVVFYMGGDDVFFQNALLEPGPSASGGFGDPRLHLKFDILNGMAKADSKTFGLAFLAVLHFPLGDAIEPDSFMGDSLIVANPKLAFEARFWKMRLGLNLGYVWREKKQFWQAEVGQRIGGGAAGELAFTENIKAILEITGEKAIDSSASSSALEMHGAMRFQVAEHVWLDVGMGGGLPLGGGDVSYGIGTPKVRVLAGVRIEVPEKEEPKVVDTDRDGILDPQDECPAEKEDRDRFQDEDGCPDPDNDQDGVPDKKDKCPTKKEDKDGYKDTDGCPDSDNDMDDILDEDDDCPNQAEDEDGFQDEDGCPEMDNDQDGFLDPQDRCPNEAEVFNGAQDDDGCPDAGQQLAVMKGGQIQISEQVNFATGSAKLVGKRSFEILDSVAAILKAQPDVKIRVEGHTDDRGKRAANVKLSENRAKSVRQYLIDKGGIAAERLEAQGFGPDRPIDNNRTAKGRAANRRVEFHIVK